MNLLKTTTDFLENEDNLEQSEAFRLNVVAHLGGLGGIDYKDAVRTAWRACITDELLSKGSWTGIRHPRFMDSHLESAIYDALLLGQFSDITPELKTSLPRFEVEPNHETNMVGTTQWAPKGKEIAKENYTSLLGRSKTVVSGSIEDIQSVEFSINTSFDNPLFKEKKEKDNPQENDYLESSTEDGAILKAFKSLRFQSSLSGSDELNGTYSSSGADIFSAKDSFNSIPSTKNEHYLRPAPKHPQKALFEVCARFMEAVTGRPFYSDRETHAKSRKLSPRSRGTGPMIKGVSIEEEEVDGDTGLPKRLLRSAESDHDLKDEGQSQQWTFSQVVAMEAVLEARNPALPPLSPDWIESIDSYVEKVRVLRQGVLRKPKLTKNGNWTLAKIRKDWTSAWVFLTDLITFKESASTKMAVTLGNSEAESGSSAALSATTNKPELCVGGGRVAAVKCSRKGVFQVYTLIVNELFNSRASDQGRSVPANVKQLSSAKEREMDGDTGMPERLLSYAESDQHHTDEGRSQPTTRSQVAAMEARNRALPPVTPGWIDSIDPYAEEVVYPDTSSGAKWNTSLDTVSLVFFYYEDSQTSVCARGVFYSEGSKLFPELNQNSQQTPSIPTVWLSKWDQLRHRTAGPSSKLGRDSITCPMVLTNFSFRNGAGQTVVHLALSASVTVSDSKTASFPTHSAMSFQWSTLQSGSFVRDRVLLPIRIRVPRQSEKKNRTNWTSSWADLLTDLCISKKLASTEMAKLSVIKSPEADGVPLYQPLQTSRSCLWI